MNNGFFISLLAIFSKKLPIIDQYFIIGCTLLIPLLILLLVPLLVCFKPNFSHINSVIGSIIDYIINVIIGQKMLTFSNQSGDTSGMFVMYMFFFS